MRRRALFLAGVAWMAAHWGVALVALWWWAFAGDLPTWLGGGDGAVATFALIGWLGMFALIDGWPDG